MDRQQLETELAKNGYWINKSGNGLNDFIHTNKDDCTQWRVRDHCIEYVKDGFEMVFNFDKSEVKWLDNHGVAVSAKDNYSVFVNFYTQS